MIEGYQLSLFEPESPEYIQQVDRDIRDIIAKIAKRFKVPEIYHLPDPRIVVTTTFPTDVWAYDKYNQEKEAAAGENYILIRPEYAGSRRHYAEEAMHFLRNNLILRQLGVHIPLVEEFFGGLASLMFSDTEKVGSGYDYVKEYSKLADEVGKSMGVDPKLVREFKRDVLTHPLAYTLADHFHEKGLLEGYPSIFFMHPRDVVGILAREVSSRRRIGVSDDISFI